MAFEIAIRQISTRHNMCTHSLIIVLLAIVRLIDGELTASELLEICPDERPYCIKKAEQGECYGNSLKAQALKKTCQCSCGAMHHERIQTCCKTLGKQEMSFCLPLCGYNTTIEELSSTLGFKCVSQLTTWAYCAADANDNVACCEEKGVASDCLSFCKGDVPTCDLQSIFSYQPCLKDIKAIIQCQVMTSYRLFNY
uniref:DB domain-containing protein n=1 Tax=Ascaris lumbricoides TaxID=6252 RepID=A0A0M3IM37_ASCLU